MSQLIIEGYHGSNSSRSRGRNGGEKLLTDLFHRSYSVMLLIHPSATWSGVIPPTMGWVIPLQSTNKNVTDMPTWVSVTEALLN